jgi:hypothetical protein
VTHVQPVVPISLSRDWNVISRTILPLAYQSHVVDDGGQGGLGDTLQSLFFSPKEPTKGFASWRFSSSRDEDPFERPAVNGTDCRK